MELVNCMSFECELLGCWEFSKLNNCISLCVVLAVEQVLLFP